MPFLFSFIFWSLNRVAQNKRDAFPKRMPPTPRMDTMKVKLFDSEQTTKKRKIEKNLVKLPSSNECLCYEAGSRALFVVKIGRFWMLKKEKESVLFVESSLKAWLKVGDPNAQKSLVAKEKANFWLDSLLCCVDVDGALFGEM